MDVTDLFRSSRLFLDRDGDGYPDDLNLQIQVDPGLTDPQVWSGIINLAARLAFQVVALERPVVAGTGCRSWKGPVLTVLAPGKRPPGQSQPGSEAVGLWRESDQRAWLWGHCGALVMRELNRLSTGGISDRPGKGDADAPAKDCRRERTDEYRPAAETQQDPVPVAPNWLNLGGAEGLYQTVEDDPRCRRLRLALRLCPGSLSFQVGRALANSIAHLALDATEIELPLARVDGADAAEAEDPAQVILEIREDADRDARIELVSQPSGRSPVVRAGGPGRALASLLQRWLHCFRHQHGKEAEPADALRDEAAAFQDLVNGNGTLGPWAHHLAQGLAVNPTEMSGMPETTRRFIRKACRALQLPEPPELPGPLPVRRTRRWPDEVAAIIRAVSELPVSAGTVRGRIWISKPAAVRERLNKQLEQLLREKGAEPAITVLNAYKPGQCWLLEEVLPRLRKLAPLGRIEICYRPFQGREAALEMRSRWLQELFPAPEMLVKELGVSSGALAIREDPQQATVYRVLARDQNHHPLLDLGFSPPVTRIPYLSRFPELGSVHPTTAGLLLVGADGRRWERVIATDRLRFWKIFQDEWLPLLFQAMEERLRHQRCSGESVFWKELRIRVAIDETDRELGFENERIAPLEALHEDLYFVLLDAFAAFSKALNLPDTLQLGQVIPVVESKATNNGPSAELLARPMPWPTSPGRNGAPGPQIKLSEIGWERGKWRLAFSSSRVPTDPHRFERLATVAQAWGYAAGWDGNRFTLRLRPPRRRVSGTKPPAEAPPVNRLLHVGEVDRWIERLAALDAVEVWQPARTFRDRPVWALELTSKRPGAVYSTAKLRLLKPTLLVNARHHANEVSSTQAALDLAWHLATTEQGHEIRKQINVVLIPLENRDGVALFEELLPQCPGHKLHAARYNALGSEYYGDYHRERPRFPEARAKKRLWDRWLPEFMVDHHGVPHHEWDQPFSGYAPHRFREFWIPRTFVYAYIPFIDNEDHPHAALARELAAKLAERMATAEDICARNRRIADLYQRYAKGVEPEQFPPSCGEPLLVLPFVPRVYRHNFAFLYPHITRTDIVVEVPDEVADGRQLALCVQAHRLIQETLLEELRNRPLRSVRRTSCGPGFYRYTWR